VAGVRNQTGEPDTMPSENTVHIAIELSFSSWLVAARLTGAKKSRLHRIEGGDTGALLALIAELRSRAEHAGGRVVDLPDEEICDISAGYEA
jgi:transposase